MTSEKQYFLNLLSSFLNNTAPQPQSVDWQQIFNLAKIHDVVGIIAQQIKYLPNEFKPNAPFASYFNQTLGLTIQNYTQKEDVKLKVKSFLDENNFDHIFVKGSVIRQYYPVPELRTSGDIDVILNSTDFDNFLSKLKSSNATFINITSETITVKLGTIPVEFHKYADVKSSYFNNIFALSTKIDNHTFALDEYNHLLYVVCHLCKHLAYRGAGVRMLMDIDVLVRCINNFNQQKFISMCKNAGFEKSAQVLLSLCNYWFNTPVEPYVDFNNEQQMLSHFENIMLDGGSFGFEINSIPLKNANNSKFKTLLNLAFPNKEFLKLAYPYYQKNSLLLPVARANRIVDGMFKKRKQTLATVEQLASNNNVSNIQRSLLNEIGINEE